MTSQVGHHGWDSQLYPSQDSAENYPARKSILNRLWILFQVLGRICFHWPLLFLYSMTFMLVLGEEQTGVCKLMDPATICDMSSVVNFESTGICPCSSTEELPMRRVVVMMVLAIIGVMGLVRWTLRKCCRVFTEADIKRGLASGPAVARRSNPTFEILPSIN